MKFMNPQRMQMASVVAVMGMAILSIIEVLKSLIEMILVNGPVSVLIAPLIATAAGLFTWVAKAQLDIKTEEETDS